MKKLNINQNIPPNTSLFRKLNPKYLNQWNIEDLNYMTPYEHSNFPIQLFRSVKRTKFIRRVKFSGDLNQESILPISHLIKSFKKYISEISASGFVRKKLMFLKHLNLKSLTVQFSQQKDWRLLLFNRNIQDLQIFINKSKNIYRSIFPAAQNPNENREESSEQVDLKIYQLCRLCKCLQKLNKLNLNGEYDDSFLKLLGAFDSNLKYLSSFENLFLTITYDDTLPSHILENTRNLKIWSYLSDLSLKLNSSLNLLKYYLETPHKFTNLKQLEIYSLFVVENDFSFFSNFSLLPYLTDIKIVLYGLNGSQSLVRFLSFMSFPDKLENFSLVVRNNIPWAFDYEKGPSHLHSRSCQRSSSFTRLLQAWRNLRKLYKIQIRVNLQFRESDIYLLGEFFQIFSSLKDLDLEIGNDCEWINGERTFEPFEMFDLNCLMQEMGKTALQIDKLNIVAPNMMLREIPESLEMAIKRLQCLTLKSSLVTNKEFVQFVKHLPNEIEKFVLDELLIKQNSELEYALEAFQSLKVAKTLKLTFCLDRKIKNIEVVEGLLKIIKHFKQTEELVLFLNNYLLGNQCFFTIRNEIKRVGRKLKQGVGKISDFNCNLGWSCKDCKIFYNQLDFFTEDFY